VDRIEFRRVADGPKGGRSLPTIHPVVNGVLLRDLVKTVELPYAKREGQRALAGSYMGLTNFERLIWPAKHYFGEPIEQWFDDGDTVLLGCECGEAGCWPLTAQVEVGTHTVQWTHFRTGHRDWDLSELGPFTFRTDQYRSALEATQAH
jgi:hypothetical protein